MPTHAGGASKIRKRRCSSSSSTSSVLKKYRFKRAILMGKRGGFTTPVPAWKMNAGSPSSAAGDSEAHSQYQASYISSKVLQAPVSARKLATALWAMNKIPVLPVVVEDQQGRSRVVRSMKLGSRPHRLPNPSHSLDSETDAGSQDHNPTSSVIGMKICLKDLNNGLMTSRELVKLLGHVWRLEEEKHASSISLVSALRVELDRACVHVNQLIKKWRSDQKTINHLKENFAEERSAWKSKEQERIRAAVCSLMEELESEKRSRRRAERIDKKLELELAKTRASLSKAVKELESERRYREIIEKICNKLGKKMGKDKAEVEVLKRKSSKVREELEKEREMLQIADEWREERVQMKLLEAKFQFEEKNTAVDQLRRELEVYLTSKRGIASKSCRANYLVVDEEPGYEEKDEVDSENSDVGLIELNMDTNNKSYSWSYEPDQEILSESSQGQKMDQERYMSVKALRDRMLAASGVALPQGSASPIQKWSRPQASQEMIDRVCEGSNITDLVKAIGRV